MSSIATQTLREDPSPETATGNLAVVVCGSFRRAVAELKSDVAELLASRCDVLSPVSTDFVAEVDGFAYSEHELERDPVDIERGHLDAIRSADMIWVHAPNGYLGPSASFELGVALAAGIPIFSRNEVADVALRGFITLVQSPRAAAGRSRAQPPEQAGAPLETLQRYYERAAARRGWSDEGPAESMLLLTEEVGELARAVRKRVGLARANNNDADISEELADVQLYVVHLANVLGIDLAGAVSIKERENHKRFRSRSERAA